MEFLEKCISSPSGVSTAQYTMGDVKLLEAKLNASPFVGVCRVLATSWSLSQVPKLLYYILQCVLIFRNIHREIYYVSYVQLYWGLSFRWLVLPLFCLRQGLIHLKKFTGNKCRNVETVVKLDPFRLRNDQNTYCSDSLRSHCESILQWSCYRLFRIQL